MNDLLQIRPMIQPDVEVVFQALEAHGIGKPMDYIKRCAEQNITGERMTLIALYDSQFAGWLHLLSRSSYPYFAERDIPEINNFDVVPSLRRRGIGSALMPWNKSHLISMALSGSELVYFTITATRSGSMRKGATFLTEEESYTRISRSNLAAT